MDKVDAEGLRAKNVILSLDTDQSCCKLAMGSQMKHFQEPAITEKVCSLYKGSDFVHVYFMGGDGEL